MRLTGHCSLTLRSLSRVVILSLWIGGCGANTNVGPIAVTEAFVKTINASLDLKGEAIRHYGRVQWYPGVDTHDEWLRAADATADGVVV